MPSLSNNSMELVVTLRDGASGGLRTLKGNVSELSDEAKRGQGATGMLANAWSGASEASNRLAMGVGIAAAAVGGLASLGMGSLIKYTVNSTREVQTYVAGIKGLTKNTEEASDVIKSMIDYVQGKPFDRIEVLGAARNLLVFGRTAAEAKQDIELLGRASIISGRDVGSLSQIYGRVASSGRMMTDDFNQLMYAGVNIGKSLSKNLGVPMDELRELLSEGKVSFKQFHKALEDALPADAVAKNSNTINNKLLSLQSSFRNLGFVMLGVDFSRLSDDGQPLVKPGGVLDLGIQLMQRLTTLLRSPAVVRGFEALGQAAVHAASFGLALFGAGMAAIGKTLDWFKRHSSAARLALAALAAGLGGALLPALISATVAAVSFLAPIIGLVAVCAALGVGVQLVVNRFGGWGAMLERVKPALHDVRTIARMLFDTITGGDPTVKRSEERFAGLARWLLRARGVGADAVVVFRMLLDTVTGGDPTLTRGAERFASFSRWLLAARDSVESVSHRIAELFLPVLRSIGATLSTSVMPILSRLWNEVLLPLGPIVGTVLGAAFMVLVGALYLLAQAVNFVLPGLIWLTNLFVSLARFVLVDLPTAFGAGIAWIAEKVTWLQNHFFEAVGFIVGFFLTLPVKLPMLAILAVAKIIEFLTKVDWLAVAGLYFKAWAFQFNLIKDAALGLFNWLKNINWGETARGVSNSIIGYLEGAINGALSGIPGVPKVKIPRFATGTNYAPGGMAWVGERGPELINLPRGSQVYTNAQSRQMSGAGGGDVVVHVAKQIINNEGDAKSWARQLGQRVNP